MTGHHPPAPVAEFALAATSGHEDDARRILDAHPEIADNEWVRLIRGEEWHGDVHAQTGPLGWEPLLYVAYSCFDCVDLARDLLAQGADPNATFHDASGQSSALHGATDPELVQLLVDAGAKTAPSP
ncbi:MAG: hypothetical protein JHC95_18575 [Solirubrobacteraceae bacterium]|nr:hypothetical protein [Solirubrobacteraceae bacterium]